MKNWNVFIYTHCPEGTDLSWEGGRMFPEVLMQAGNSAPEFLFFMSHFEAPAVAVTPVLSQLLCRM